jgi:hypothetical protein
VAGYLRYGILYRGWLITKRLLKTVFLMVKLKSSLRKFYRRHNSHRWCVRVLASSAVDRGFVPRRVKPKIIKLVFVASPITGWLGIRIMSPSGATCLSADCCFTYNHGYALLVVVIRLSFFPFHELSAD